MSTADFLKAALEKKKQKTQTPGKNKGGSGNKETQGNQVTTNRPQKRAAGRGG